MSSRFVAAKRVALCAFGICLVSFGVALTASSNLGTSPISSVAWVAHCVSIESDYLPQLTFGTTTLLLNLLFFFVQWAIQGRAFGKLQFLQIPCTFVFGVLIDLSMALCAYLPASFYPLKVMEVVVGCAFVAMGLACEFAADVLYLPGDGVVKTLANAIKLKTGVMKITFDAFLTVSAALISFLLIAKVVGIREGTLISAFAVGFFLRLFQPTLDKLRVLTRR
ncbi:MAG: YitT family protein [Thermoguttaceae bacterium]